MMRRIKRGLKYIKAPTVTKVLGNNQAIEIIGNTKSIADRSTAAAY